jgi:P-type Cu2+ transporter
MSSPTCFHCSEPVTGSAPLVARVGGHDRPVCCIGCRAAAEWIATLGLQDYYRLRDSAAPRAAGADDYSAWDRSALQKLYVHRRADGSAEIGVVVEGVRCAACGWLIERSLAMVDGVRETSVNVPGRRVTIVWQPQAVALSAVLGAIARLGYAPHPLDRASLDAIAAREQRSALKRLVVAGLGMMQAMMFAVVLYAGAFDGMDTPTRDFFRWIGLLVTIPVVFYSARPFFAGALRELRARHPGMDTPVALAVGLVFSASVLETVLGGASVYFDSASMFVFLLLGGRYLEMRARHRAADVVDALARLQPAVARRRTASGATEDVGVHELEVGDRVVVADGAAVPADGCLVSAACRVDESLLSGESRPQQRFEGDRLIAGSVVVEGPAEMHVERLGADTALSAIVRLIARAQQQRPRWVRYGDRAATRFVLGLLLATLATAAIWIWFDPARAFSASVAVLVVACPCAFALAIPAALARALAVMARHGILAISPDAVEALQRADYFVFDKTGTLTERRIEVAESTASGPMPAAQCLDIAARLEAGSTHPVAAAIRAAAGAVTGTAATGLAALPGCGVEGVVDGRRYRLGHAAYATPALAQDGDEDVILSDGAVELARFRLRETVRAEAPQTLDSLRAAGTGIEILSGDSTARVAALAARLGIARWRARQNPEQKLARLAELRAEGHTVAVIGDGVNDAPALAGADLAIAIGGGAELAHSSADIVLAGDRLDALLEARGIARASGAVMRQNLIWAVAYNAAALPLAALGLVPPWLAAIGMSFSSLAVIANSLRIGAWQPGPAPEPATPQPDATAVPA